MHILVSELALVASICGTRALSLLVQVANQPRLDVLESRLCIVVNFDGLSNLR